MLTRESSETSEAHVVECEKASWIWTDFAPPARLAPSAVTAEPMNVRGIVEGLGALLMAMDAMASDAWN